MVITVDSGEQDDSYLINNNQEYSREELAQMIIEGANRIWVQFKVTGNKLLTEWGLYDAFDRIARLAARHPFAALSAMLAILVVFLPFTILIAFGLSTMAMTFTGFLFLEGTLLTIASVLLFGCLGALLLVFLFFGAVTVAGYFGFVHIYDIYSDSNNRTALRQLLRREQSQIDSPRQ